MKAQELYRENLRVIKLYTRKRHTLRSRLAALRVTAKELVCGLVGHKKGPVLAEYGDSVWCPRCNIFYEKST